MEEPSTSGREEGPEQRPPRHKGKVQPQPYTTTPLAAAGRLHYRFSAPAAQKGQAMGPRGHRSLGCAAVYEGGQPAWAAGGVFVCCAVPQVQGCVLLAGQCQAEDRHILRSFREMTAAGCCV
jgi:hypothetical protein